RGGLREGEGGRARSGSAAARRRRPRRAAFQARHESREQPAAAGAVPAAPMSRPMRRLCALFLLLALAGAAPASADEGAALAALRSGGHVALMRHGEAPGVADPPGFRVDDCATQRNLSEKGRADAAAMGARLRDARAWIGKIVSSPWCRCRDT